MRIGANRINGNGQRPARCGLEFHGFPSGNRRCGRGGASNSASTGKLETEIKLLSPRPSRGLLLVALDMTEGLLSLAVLSNPLFHVEHAMGLPTPAKSTTPRAKLQSPGSTLRHTARYVSIY